MNLIDIECAYLATGRVKDKRQFNRYIKLIKYYRELELPVIKGKTESHHIMTRAIFPENVKDTSNLINLPYKAHYLAHYFLFKSIRHRSCVYAFNQMRRITKLAKPNCRLYATVRLEFIKLISQNNSGIKRTDWQKQQQSKVMSGTNTYRNIESKELKRFKVGDEPSGWVCFQTGRIRTDESKARMSTNMQGRMWQYNAETKEVKFEKDTFANFVVGFPPWMVQDTATASDTVWIHHIHSHKNKRLHKCEPIPEDFAFGRIFENKGFAKINNQEFTKVADLLDKTFCLIETSLLPNPRYVVHGMAIDKICLYLYNNKVFTSMQDLLSFNPHLPKTKGGIELENAIVPNQHWNQTTERQQFCKNNGGKTYADIGVKVIPLNEYHYNETEIYVKCK